MDAFPGGYGPKDLVPLHHRKGCPPHQSSKNPVGSQDDLEEEEYIEVDWRISFSARTPLKSTLGDVIAPGVNVNLFPELRANMTEEERERSQSTAQDSIEATYGVMGHTSADGAHPRRRVGLEVVMFMLTMINHIQLVHYWYTLPSTTGLTILPSTIHAFLSLASTLLHPRQYTEEYLNPGLPGFMGLLVDVLDCWFMLLAILRIEMGWRGIRREAETRAEKKSERVDEGVLKTSKKIMVFGIVALGFWITGFPDALFIRGQIPERSPAHRTLSSRSLTIVRVFEALASASYFTLAFFQQALNYRLGSFAGCHRSSTFVMLAFDILFIASGTERVVGAYSGRPGIGWHTIVATCFACSRVWQAVTLGNVRKVEEHEE